MLRRNQRWTFLLIGVCAGVSAIMLMFAVQFRSLWISYVFGTLGGGFVGVTIGLMLDNARQNP